MVSIGMASENAPQEHNVLGQAQRLVALASRAHDTVGGFEPLDKIKDTAKPAVEPQGAIATLRELEQTMVALCERLERISMAVGRL